VASEPADPPFSPSDPAWLPLARELREQDPPLDYMEIVDAIAEAGFGRVTAMDIRKLLPPPEQVLERLG
jgi:hypothetical protein